MRKDGFAERACSARLTGNGQELSVADDAGEVGIDVLGADLGFGKPVVAFQIDQTRRGSAVSYQIYSLAKPFNRLYMLKVGDSYSAADTDMDGRVEIWINATAIDGFERIPKADLDVAPTVVLRFEKGHLVDVGPEFIPYYDALIAKIRSEITDVDLAGFKQSDGKLMVNSPQSGALHNLIRTKISVLELVCAYLYSGRQKEAWDALEAMWPAGDVARIRSALLDLHERGIVHDVEQSRRAPPRSNRAKIYAAVATSQVVSTVNPYGGAPDSSQAEPP
jgi:hypothetical protein